MKPTKTQIQQRIDAFYKSHGPCCAGCDHWRWFGITVGECLKSNIMSAKDRVSMLGMTNFTGYLPAGQVITPRNYLCGNFDDTYAW